MMDSLIQYEFFGILCNVVCPLECSPACCVLWELSAIWGGVDEGRSSAAGSPKGPTQSKDEQNLGSGVLGGGSSMVQMGDVDVMECSSLNKISKCRNRHNSLTESHAGLKPVALGVDVDSIDHDRSLFVKLKEERDIAKAVKDDDAEVPVELWNQAVCRGVASERECFALDTLRVFTPRVYRWRLGREVQEHLSSKFGRVCHDWWVAELKKCDEVWKYIAVFESKDEREDHSSLGGEWKDRSRRGMSEVQSQWKADNVNSWLVRGWARKAVHKRSDAFHIFLIPRLFTPPMELFVSQIFSQAL